MWNAFKQNNYTFSMQQKPGIPFNIGDMRTARGIFQETYNSPNYSETPYYAGLVRLPRNETTQRAINPQPTRFRPSWWGSNPLMNIPVRIA